MNVNTDLTNLIHPAVYKDLAAKAAEKNMPIEIALVFFFNRMCMKALGLEYAADSMFFHHEQDVFTFTTMKRDDVVEEKRPSVKPAPIVPLSQAASASAPKAPPKAEAEEEEDVEWYAGFPKRAINAIITAGIQSLEDLVENYGLGDFAELKGAGESTAAALGQVLAARGVKMKPGKLIAPVDTTGAAKTPKAAPAAAVSKETSDKLGAKAKALSETLAAQPSVSRLDEDDEIDADYYKEIADLKITDPNDTSWVQGAIAIYAKAWNTDIPIATKSVRDIMSEGKVTSKDFGTWARGKAALLNNLPAQPDQLELIEKYAAECGIESINDYVLAEFNVEGGPKQLTMEEASLLMKNLNEKEWF